VIIDQEDSGAGIRAWGRCTGEKTNGILLADSLPVDLTADHPNRSDLPVGADLDSRERTGLHERELVEDRDESIRHDDLRRGVAVVTDLGGRTVP